MQACPYTTMVMPHLGYTKPNVEFSNKSGASNVGLTDFETRSTEAEARVEVITNACNNEAI